MNGLSPDEEGGVPFRSHISLPKLVCQQIGGPPTGAERSFGKQRYVYDTYSRSMKRKLTITVSEAVYEGLHRTIGRRRISQFIEKLVRPHVVPQDLEASYRDMAADEAREQEALEWSEGVIADATPADFNASR